ncbi:hypothetical protein F4818DRAFT_411781 [Hypoxylon cercidicola]|nr:hypothetical protein F4818DRAFT_411781 [Hypoxylon cercidicola]
MSTNLYSQSTGTTLRPTAYTDEPYGTAQNHDACTTDDFSPGRSVKTESRSPITNLGQYDVTVGGSWTSSKRYTTGTDRPDTINNNYDLDPSPCADRHLGIPLRGRKLSSADGYHFPKSVSNSGAQSTKPAQWNKNPTRHHLQPEVWERYKEEIHEIYIDQNRSLSDLMELMQDKGFIATPRMYKAKFVQWGFVKNNKKKDVATMLRLQRQRGAVGKPTAFHRHGRSVDIETYMKRKGISSLELVPPTADIDLPDYLRALTPPPTEPQHMTLPSHFYAQEVLVSSFKDLSLSWRDSIVSPTSFEDDFNLYFDGELCEATRDFSRACWFFSRGHNSLGALLSQRSFASLHLLIKTPTALGLFDLLIASVISPDYGLAKELWKYLAGYAEAALGSSSTLYKLFAALGEVFRNNTLETGVDFVFSCMESIIGMLLETNDFAQTITPSMCFFLLGDLILFNSTRTNLPSLQRAVASASAITSSEASYQAPGVMRFIEPAAYLWQNGPHDEHSAELAYASLQLVDDVSNRYDWTYWVSWRVVAYFHRSRCGVDGSSAKDNPRHALARYALERAIDAAESGRGFDESQIFENMETLESWHREAGDVEQELAVRLRREKGLRDYIEALQRGRRVDIPRTPSSL